jgi:Domain of unknown function (DUF4249)
MLIHKIRFSSLLLMAALFLITSCEKELKVDLPTGKSYLVVEGEIENGALPFVILTRSIGFFDKINVGSLIFEKNATVTVTDLNTNISTPLNMFGFPFGTGTDSLFVYGLLPVVQNDIYKGQINHQYKLTIVENGVTHTAITKVADQVLPDSAWTEPIPNDSGFTIRARYKDPDTIGNNTRYTTQVLRKLKDPKLPESYLTSFGSTFNDGFNNGKELPFRINLGYSKDINFQDKEGAKTFERQTKVLIGDTVNLKFSGIDYPTYQFWETLDYSRNSTGNPFASPTKVQGNVSDAIGIWGGYGARVFTFVVK